MPVLIVCPKKEKAPEDSGRPEPAGAAPAVVAPAAEAPAVPATGGDSGRPEPAAISAQEPQAASVDSGRPDRQKPEASTSDDARPAEEDEAVEMTETALRRLGFSAREARERAQGARERLVKSGRAPLTVSDCSDLLRESFRSRWSKVVQIQPRTKSREGTRTDSA